jgi:hypothetical protein
MYTTSNGIEYEEELAGSNGMRFYLKPVLGEHNDNDITYARRELKRERDVVGVIKVEWQQKKISASKEIPQPAYSFKAKC